MMDALMVQFRSDKCWPKQMLGDLLLDVHRAGCRSSNEEVTLLPLYGKIKTPLKITQNQIQKLPLNSTNSDQTASQVQPLDVSDEHFHTKPRRSS